MQRAAGTARRRRKWPPAGRWPRAGWATFFAAARTAPRRPRPARSSRHPPPRSPQIVPASGPVPPHASHRPAPAARPPFGAAPAGLREKPPRPRQSAPARRCRSGRCSWQPWFARPGRPRRRRSACRRPRAPGTARPQPADAAAAATTRRAPAGPAPGRPDPIAPGPAGAAPPPRAPASPRCSSPPTAPASPTAGPAPGAGAAQAWTKRSSRAKAVTSRGSCALSRWSLQTWRQRRAPGRPWRRPSIWRAIGYQGVPCSAASRSM